MAAKRYIAVCILVMGIDGIGLSNTTWTSASNRDISMHCTKSCSSTTSWPQPKTQTNHLHLFQWIFHHLLTTSVQKSTNQTKLQPINTTTMAKEHHQTTGYNNSKCHLHHHLQQQQQQTATTSATPATATHGNHGKHYCHHSQRATAAQQRRLRTFLSTWTSAVSPVPRCCADRWLSQVSPWVGDGWYSFTMVCNE